MIIPSKNTNSDEVEALKRLVLAQQSLLGEKNKSITQKQDRIEHLEELVRSYRYRQFGKSSEKDYSQFGFFDETELEASEEAELVAVIIESEESAVIKASKKKSGRKALPKSLPRVHITHDLPEHEKTCECGCQKDCIREETSEQLDIIPAVIQVLVHARKVYACKACESGIATASLPKQPIPKSNASAGLLAHIAVSKYQDGLPLYRQEAQFKRINVHLPRNTMASWMIKCGNLLQPLYNLLNDHLLGSGYVHMDETRIQVLKEADKTPESLSYMWVRRTGDKYRPIILFDYDPRRTTCAAESLLPDYMGYLQTDDYAGYHKIGLRDDVVNLGCMAHARRKFTEAQKAAPSQKGKISKADMAVQMIKKLYAIETGIKDKSTEERYRIRQEKSKPHLQKIREWLDKALATTLPKGKAGTAIAYLNKNWEKLTVYID
ncbi:IS66 family transposase, partial [Marinagarivorans algicola]|uniref:IS66 family transposase n=1 Tax=Marinagarivorans algicola TaxID=1513270 RepID=UPI0006B58495